MHKVLLIGGSGLLGTEIKRYIDCDSPSHKEFDILKPKFSDDKYDIVIHCAAYTDVDEAEKESELVFDVNLGGTLNLLYEYGIYPFVYISSEYARNPVNMYAASKYAGEIAVKCFAERYLIIRTLFKKDWKADTAWEDQWTQGDYVEVIAPLIVKEIKRWHYMKESKLMYIGTGRKTMYELAQKKNPDVKPTKMGSYKGVKRPEDYL